MDFDLVTSLLLLNLIESIFLVLYVSARFKIKIFNKYNLILVILYTVFTRVFDNLDMPTFLSTRIIYLMVVIFMFSFAYSNLTTKDIAFKFLEITAIMFVAEGIMVIPIAYMFGIELSELSTIGLLEAFLLSMPCRAIELSMILLINKDFIFKRRNKMFKKLGKFLIKIGFKNTTSLGASWFWFRERPLPTVLRKSK